FRRQLELHFVHHGALARHADPDRSLARHLLRRRDEALGEIDAENLVEMARELEAAASDGAPKVERPSAPAQLDVPQRLGHAAGRKAARAARLRQQRADLLRRAIVKQEILLQRGVRFVKSGGHGYWVALSISFCTSQSESTKTCFMIIPTWIATMM